MCQRKHHGARDANLALRDVEQLGFPRVTSGRDDTVRLSQFLRAEHLPTPLYFIFSTSTQDLAFVVGGGFSCWLISAMLPNGFESIVSVCLSPGSKYF